MPFVRGDRHVLGAVVPEQPLRRGRSRKRERGRRAASPLVPPLRSTSPRDTVEPRGHHPGHGDEHTEDADRDRDERRRELLARDRRAPVVSRIATAIARMPIAIASTSASGPRRIVFRRRGPAFGDHVATRGGSIRPARGSRLPIASGVRTRTPSGRACPPIWCCGSDLAPVGTCSVRAVARALRSRSPRTAAARRCAGTGRSGRTDRGSPTRRARRCASRSCDATTGRSPRGRGSSRFRSAAPIAPSVGRACAGRSSLRPTTAGRLRIASERSSSATSSYSRAARSMRSSNRLCSDGCCWYSGRSTNRSTFPDTNRWLSCENAVPAR